MYQYSDWKCGNCRPFCIAIDDEDSKGEVTSACPRCGSESITPEADAGSPAQETDQQVPVGPFGVLDVVAAVRILNSPWDTSPVPEEPGLSLTWFSPEELCRLAELKLERQTSFRRKRMDWSELEVRQLLFLKGIRSKSIREVAKELGVGRGRVYVKYRDLCRVYGLVREADKK